MDKFVIHGGKPLFGEVPVSGAKNAAVAIIPAAIMVNGVCRIENIPMVSDVLIQMREGRLAGATLVSIYGLDELRGVTMEADGTIRISLGMMNTMDEMDEAAARMLALYRQLRAYRRR